MACLTAVTSVDRTAASNATTLADTRSSNGLYAGSADSEGLMGRNVVRQVREDRSVLAKIAQARRAETVVVADKNLLHLRVIGVHPVGEGDDAVPFVQIADLVANLFERPMRLRELAIRNLGGRNVGDSCHCCE